MQGERGNQGGGRERSFEIVIREVKKYQLIPSLLVHTCDIKKNLTHFQKMPQLTMCVFIFKCICSKTPSFWIVVQGVLTNAFTTLRIQTGSTTPKMLPLAAALQSNPPPTFNPWQPCICFSVPTWIFKLEMKIPHLRSKCGFLLISALPLAWIPFVLYVVHSNKVQRRAIIFPVVHCFGKCSPVWLPGEGPGGGDILCLQKWTRSYRKAIFSTELQPWYKIRIASQWETAVIKVRTNSFRKIPGLI